MLHSGLSHLVALFPADAMAMPEAAVFNDIMRRHAANVRDFQISHFRLNRRFGEPFWDQARDSAVPASLDHKLRLFECRGIVALGEDETFQEENWTALFNGHGLRPKSWDPLVDRTPEAEQIANFQKLLSFIATEVEGMPTLQAHIELNSPLPGQFGTF